MANAADTTVEATGNAADEAKAAAERAVAAARQAQQGQTAK